MTQKEPRRIRLFADPKRLDGFSRQTALPPARLELRRRRGDVELRDAVRVGTDSILVALVLPPTVRDGDIEADLRAVLEIGPGGYERGPDTDQLRGMSSNPTRACRRCGYMDGRHSPDCLYARR
jgi:hypothetical protein